MDRIYLIEYKKSFSQLVNIKIKNENEMYEYKDMEIINMAEDHKTKNIDCLFVDDDDEKKDDLEKRMYNYLKNYDNKTLEYMLDGDKLT